MCKKTIRPERVIQFGEGGFLRGFADWMLQYVNENSAFHGSVVVVQPIEQGLCDKLTAQDCVYTHITRGANGEEVKKIDVISRCVKPYEDFDAYLKLAENPDFKIVISNTTESGICYDADCKPTDAPPAAFPAKVAALLYRRFTLGLDGFIFLPCELIDKNGETLKAVVLRYADDWNLGDGFKAWLENSNTFCNTLVDRIVTGYPRDEIIDLGYKDDMVNTSEVFHLWVIEGPQTLFDVLPLDQAGLNVVLTDDLSGYRERKVRILNGAHTAMAARGLLKGLETVKDCVDDADTLRYIKACIFEEIIPTIDLPKDELTRYADSVMERFANPYIKHMLSSIALNSVSKFKTRVVPSIMGYIALYGKAPKHLTAALASLIQFYRTQDANDDAAVKAFMKSASTREILSNDALWGQDLSFLYDGVTRYED
jgi:tagaturonate reductase